MSVTRISNRRYKATTTDHGQHLELGPPASGTTTGTWLIDLNASADFNGSFLVVARCAGGAAADAGDPFKPIPYRRVVVNGVASDRATVSDQVSGGSVIEVPATGLSVALLAAITKGSCDILSWGVSGTSAA